MRKLALALVLLLSLAAAPGSFAATKRNSSIKCLGCERDSRGRIARSISAREQFKHGNPCPVTGRRSGACPGYDVDHKKPLYKGGSDTPDNMQWLSKSQHRAKHAKRK